MLTIAIAMMLAASGVNSEVPDRAETEESAMALASCAGFWDWMALLEASQGKAATAEQLKNTGNGAETVAKWVLANQHLLETGEATAFGRWSAMTAPKRESGPLRFTALAEQDRTDEILREGSVCKELLPFQEQILQGMRRDRATAPDE